MKFLISCFVNFLILCFAKFVISCFAKFLISCFAKYPSNFAKFKIILSTFCKTWNFDKIILNFAKLLENFVSHEIKNFVKISWNYENEKFAATVCRSGVRGGAVQPWHILCANADCTLFVFPLYCFPFCHL